MELKKSNEINPTPSKPKGPVYKAFSVLIYISAIIIGIFIYYQIQFQKNNNSDNTTSSLITVPITTNDISFDTEESLTNISVTIIPNCNIENLIITIAFKKNGTIVHTETENLTIANKGIPYKFTYNTLDILFSYGNPDSIGITKVTGTKKIWS